MNVETNHLVTLLERRISLLGSLGDALAGANADIVRCDVDGFEQRIREQERMCTEIQSLDAAIEAIRGRCAGKAQPNGNCGQRDPATAKLQDLIHRLEETKKNVRQLNEQHLELLRRSRRTVRALLNSYESFGATYANPALGAGIPGGERL